MSGPPPPTYVCNRCAQPGHWYKSCPLVISLLFYLIFTLMMKKSSDRGIFNQQWPRAVFLAVASSGQSGGGYPSLPLCQILLMQLFSHNKDKRMKPPGIGQDHSGIIGTSISSNLLANIGGVRPLNPPLASNILYQSTTIRPIGPHVPDSEITQVWLSFFRMKDSQQQNRQYKRRYSISPERRTPSPQHQFSRRSSRAVGGNYRRSKPYFNPRHHALEEKEERNGEKDKRRGRKTERKEEIGEKKEEKEMKVSSKDERKEERREKKERKEDTEMKEEKEEKKEHKEDAEMTEERIEKEENEDIELKERRIDAGFGFSSGSKKLATTTGCYYHTFILTVSKNFFDKSSFFYYICLVTAFEFVRNFYPQAYILQIKKTFFNH
ncbi:unnamed protein product [Meloidogyne enterolobii]|uniref:Uncharacterized protein n=1 Tax=Meloidogyne enterolobii TaxID=390850 RepID=A0ACB0YAW1_MELEN